jgi:putative phosphoribosyl transferase
MSTFNTIPYRDRESAGRWLAKELQSSAILEEPVVVGIPRGGIVVATEVARLLRAPLDVFVVKKLTMGERNGKTIGAVASGCVCVLNQDVLQTNTEEAEEIANAITRMRSEVMDWEEALRQGRPPLGLGSRNVVIVDDGAETGGSLRAAIAAIRSHAPASITVALPICSAQAARHLSQEAEDLVCPFTPEPFYSIGLAYERFPRVSDQLVRDCMDSLENDPAYLAGNYNHLPYRGGAREED